MALYIHGDRKVFPAGDAGELGSGAVFEDVDLPRRVDGRLAAAAEPEAPVELVSPAE